MPLISKAQYQRLLQNAAAEHRSHYPVNRYDQVPVVRLHTSDRQFTWLLTQIDPAKPTSVVCLSDHLGRVTFSSMPLLDILKYRDEHGLPLQNDLSFVGQEMIGLYEEISYGKITFDGQQLYRARYRLEALRDEDYLDSQDF